MGEQLDELEGEPDVRPSAHWEVGEAGGRSNRGGPSTVWEGRVTRKHTSAEIGAIVGALTKATNGKWSKKRTKDVMSDLDDVCEYWGHFLKRYEIIPPLRRKRIEATTRAVEKLQLALAELEAGEYASLRYLDFEHELDESSFKEISVRLRQLNEQLVWLRDTTAEMSKIAKLTEDYARRGGGVDRRNRPADFALYAMICFFHDLWMEHAGCKPDVWSDRYTGEFRGNYWAFFRAAVAPVAEQLGAKGSDGALFSRVERAYRAANMAAANMATAEEK
jgi:hypothetical protein